jgi:hypothetical protein
MDWTLSLMQVARVLLRDRRCQDLLFDANLIDGFVDVRACARVLHSTHSS